MNRNILTGIIFLLVIVSIVLSSISLINNKGGHFVDISQCRVVDIGSSITSTTYSQPIYNNSGDEQEGEEVGLTVSCDIDEIFYGFGTVSCFDGYIPLMRISGYSGWTDQSSRYPSDVSATCLNIDKSKMIANMKYYYPIGEIICCKIK